MRKLVMSLTACALLSSVALAGDEASAPVALNAQPDATVNFSGGSVAAGIGYTWGHGQLNYENTAHEFTISGLSVVDVGAASIAASGHVYNLKQLSDFSGNYTAVSAGAALGGGGSAAYLRNEHGVVIKVESTTVGVRFNLAAEGVSLKLKS